MYKSFFLCSIFAGIGLGFYANTVDRFQGELFLNIATGVTLAIIGNLIIFPIVLFSRWRRRVRMTELDRLARLSPIERKELERDAYINKLQSALSRAHRDLARAESEGNTRLIGQLRAFIASTESELRRHQA